MGTIPKPLQFMIPFNMSNLLYTLLLSVQLGVKLQCYSQLVKREKLKVFISYSFMQSSQGHRAALPSASIMIKQPINSFRGQVWSILRYYVCHSHY